MVAKILFTKGAPAYSDIERFQEKLGKFQVETELIEADSKDGIRLTELYDAMDRPAVLLIREGGGLVQKWQGTLPTVEEVSYLAHI
ncbi:MAG TPA: hypothetical protein VNA68_02695 [Candidatus Dormibacteraeota bacterium]|nr:hypothetical protein [Candidatus Dormibacteraeota bacterium]